MRGHSLRLVSGRVDRRAETQIASIGEYVIDGRRTEIEFVNDDVVQTARSIGRESPLSQALPDRVHDVEHGALKADPKHIMDLRRDQAMRVEEQHRRFTTVHSS